MIYCDFILKSTIETFAVVSNTVYRVKFSNVNGINVIWAQEWLKSVSIEGLY